VKRLHCMIEDDLWVIAVRTGQEARERDEYD
jgi:hypothetical protein